MSSETPSGAPRYPDYPKPPFPKQTQQLPGSFRLLEPAPDHGEESWRGAGRLEGMVALITGGDSGIGRCRCHRLCPRGRRRRAFLSGGA